MNTAVVARNFDLGFKTDVSRDQLPVGAAYRLKDYIPQLKAPARGRGGWSYATKDLNTVSVCTNMAGIGWYPFAGDPHLITVSEGGKVFQTKVFDGTHGSYIGTTSFANVTHNPFFHSGLMVICAPLGSDSAPYKYYDTGGGVFGIAALGGSPPHAAVGASWGSYMILANGYVSAVAYKNRAWWSDPGSPETWNTGTSFWTFEGLTEIVKVVPMQNTLIFFGYEDTYVLVGDTPPPGGNLQERLLFAGNGCMDGRSVATYKEYVIWANSAGIFKTDGAVLTDLTFRTGVLSYWRDLLSDFNFTNGWSACGEILYGHYIVTVHNAAGTHVVTLAFDLEREIVFELTHIPALMYARRASGPGTASESGHEELFFAHKSAPRAVYMSSCWDPANAGMQDADGTNVLPEIETAFYTLGSSGQKRMRRAYVTYGLTDGGGAPSLTVSFTLTPEENGAYTAASPTLGATTIESRSGRVYVNRKALGVGFKIAQTGRSTDTRLATIELEGHALAPER